jgi:hypothetical protein
MIRQGLGQLIGLVIKNHAVVCCRSNDVGQFQLDTPAANRSSHH